MLNTIEGQAAVAPSAVERLPRTEPQSTERTQLSIDAPSAAAAFVLAGSLGRLRARAVYRGDAWVVLVSPLRGGPSAIAQALSATRDWLLECNVPATSVSYDGRTHLMRREDAEPLTQLP